MSEQNIPLEPLRGRRSNLDALSLKDGSMEFAYDTGGLYFDVKTASGTVERIQVSTDRLVKTQNNDGTLITNTLSFDQVNNKLDRVTSKDSGTSMEGHIVTLNADGTLRDSGLKQDEIGLSSALMFTEITLSSNNWISTTKTQIVSCPNVDTDSIVIVSPKEPEISTKYNIYCNDQGNGSLTFKYLNSIPKEDVTFNIIIYGNIPNDNNTRRVLGIAELNPNNWSSKLQTQRYYNDAIKTGSVITVSPVDIEKAMPYNIIAISQGTSYIDFKYINKPDEPIQFYVFIENYN